MPQVKNRSLRCALAGLMLAAPALQACAQEPLPEPKNNGIKLGDARIHPFVEIEGRYDSAASTDATTRLPVPDLIFHFRPGLNLTLPSPRVAVDFVGRLDWAQYGGVVDATTRDRSRLFGDVELGLGINRSGAVGMEVNDSFRRSDNANSFVSYGAITNFNDLTLKAPLRPGGGALLIDLSGNWQLETYESRGTCPVAVTSTGSTSICDVGKLGYNQYTGAASARWKFLPRTAIVLEGSYFFRAPFDTGISREIQGIRLMTGLSGLVTTHLAGTLKGGYGDTLGSGGTSFRTWLGNAEVEYLTDGWIGGKLGYVHNYSVDPGDLTALYRLHRAYVEGKLGLMGGRLALRTLVSAEYLDYPLAPGRESTVLRIAPSVDFELYRWVYLASGYSFNHRLSNLDPSLNFNKNEFWIRGIFIY